jgi:hypothetical protein
LAGLRAANDEGDRRLPDPLPRNELQPNQDTQYLAAETQAQALHDHVRQFRVGAAGEEHHL